jgi:hypothetical protein
VADDRSKRDKLRAMANQTASPHEAKIAREKLAALDAAQPGVETFVRVWRYVDLAAGKAVSTPDLLTATRMWAKVQGIEVKGGFSIQSDDLAGVIRVSFLGIKGKPLATPLGPAADHMPEHTSTSTRYRDATSYFGGIDFAGGQDSTHFYVRRHEAGQPDRRTSQRSMWKAAMRFCICGSGNRGALHSTICAQARASMASQAGY